MTLRVESYTIITEFSSSTYVEINQMFSVTMSSALLLEDYTAAEESCATEFATRSG